MVTAIQFWNGNMPSGVLETLLPSWMHVFGRSYDGVSLADEIVSARKTVDVVADELANAWRQVPSERPRRKAGSVFNPGIA